jgi:hypothetical protein
MRGWPLGVVHVFPRVAPPVGKAGRPPLSIDLDDPSNLAAACQLCNRAKSTAVIGYDRDTGNWHPIFNPRQDQWYDHFDWSEDYLRIVGLTPTGRATVNQLQLNRATYRQQRRILRAAARGGDLPWP